MASGGPAFTRRLRFGLMFLQAAPFADVVDRVRRGEEMNFDSLWVADHMTGQYPTLISFEAWSLLSALAMATTTATIGPMVTPIMFRHPALFAMSATTLDHASGGRLEIGVGIGGAPVDGTVVGAEDWPGAERVSRLEEEVDLLDRLLRGERVDGHTGYYRPRGPSSSGRSRSPAATDHRRGRATPHRPGRSQGRRLEHARRPTDARPGNGGRVPQRGAGNDPSAGGDARGGLCAGRAAGRFDPPPRPRLSRQPGAVRLGRRVQRLRRRYHEAGIDAFIFYWPVDPATFERVPAYEHALEKPSMSSRG